MAVGAAFAMLGHHGLDGRPSEQIIVVASGI
jgi:hypothetical protein